VLFVPLSFTKSTTPKKNLKSGDLLLLKTGEKLLPKIDDFLLLFTTAMVYMGAIHSILLPIPPNNCGAAGFLFKRSGLACAFIRLTPFTPT
jgi:hypothetical protein